MKMKKFLTMVLLLCISLPAFAEWKMLRCNISDGMRHDFRYDVDKGKFEEYFGNGGWGSRDGAFITETTMGDGFPTRISRDTGAYLREFTKGNFDRGTCVPFKQAF
jgi:hypothetical protein